jgi:uncharacterized repeat protein (TIGR01451 family)
MSSTARITPWLAATLAAALYSGALWAQAAKAPAVTLVNKAEMEIEVEQKQPDGKVVKVKKLVEPQKIVPGDEVMYTTTYRNNTAAPYKAEHIINPVPANTRYVDGSAFGAGTEITFSVDGGKTYKAPKDLTIKDKDDKGKPRERPAEAADYTHVRWSFTAPLEPGKEGFVRFRAQVK